MASSDQSSSNYIQEEPTPLIPADQWFEQGERVLYDPDRRKIIKENSTSSKPGPNVVRVWKRIVQTPSGTTSSHARWMTLLPGPPEGSYGFSKVDSQLQIAPRLYLDYVGLGDSDKPSKYAHSVMDRANLVEAHWRHHKIRRTILVCSMTSSTVMMELLQRQQDRLAVGLPPRTRIEHVLCLNGGYYAEAHTPHPLNNNAIVHKTLGKVMYKSAQYCDSALERLVRSCFAPEHQISKPEMAEIFQALRRRNGLSYFNSRASRYVEEHERFAARWNLDRVYKMTRKQGISFTLVGGEHDRFEHLSFATAKKHLGGLPNVYIESLPGGLCLALEFPRRIASLIDGVAMAPAFDVDDESVWGHKRVPTSHDTEPSSASETGSLTTSYTASTMGSGWADAELLIDHEFPL